MDYSLWLPLAVLLPVLLYFYVRANDAKLTRLPPEATAFSPRRWTVEDLERTASSPALAGSSPSLFSPDELPPKTGRRYIVIGGAGFLGGWIVLHLLARGESPRRIRILDVRRPTRQDMLEGSATEVEFCQVDVTNAAAVEAAFRKPWADDAAPGESEPEPELTVFHTVAIIRFYERHPALQVYSDRVNVQGTRNVIDAARKVGAAALIYTSSGSVSVRRSRFWLWPWEREPAHFVQPIGDDDAQVPTRHEHFFSNYAVSKRKAEVLVRRANGLSSGNGILRTGCVRPGNAIYGTGGDLLVAAYLLRKANMTWIANSLQSFCYVENCSVAHLCYEQRLIELQRGSPNPDVGGQAFCVCDAGPPPTYGEINRGMTYLSAGACTFQDLSPTAMLALATLVEAYYLTRQALLRAPAPFAALAKLVPALSGDIVFLQPSMWALTQVHLVFDDSRARAAPALGGLGYSGRVTTIEGTCKVFAEHTRTGGRERARVIAGHDSPDLALALSRAEKSVEEVMEKLGASLDKPRVAELQY